MIVHRDHAAIFLEFVESHKSSQPSPFLIFPAPDAGRSPRESGSRPVHVVKKRRFAPNRSSAFSLFNFFCACCRTPAPPAGPPPRPPPYPPPPPPTPLPP